MNTTHKRAALHYLIGANQPKLVSAVTLMEANIEEPLGLDELASYGNISRRQLERLFLKYLGCSPSRYYLQLRLFRARLLLVQTNMPIIDIAVSCGFSTAPQFQQMLSRPLWQAHHATSELPSSSPLFRPLKLPDVVYALPQKSQWITNSPTTRHPAAPAKREQLLSFPAAA